MSTFGFMNGAYNLASGTLAAFGRLSDALVREGHPRMVSKSGDREPQDQIDTFLSRYRAQATGSGPYGDVRWWNGVRYVRHSSAGPVAVPGNSNHEKRRANDLAYPYNSSGTAAHRRAKDIAPRYGITCEGLGFGEPWHWTFWGDLGAINIPAGGQTAKPAHTDQSEEDTVKDAVIISYSDESDPKRNGIVGAAPGFWHKFTAEEWGNRAVKAAWEHAPVIKPGNAREYDILRASLTQGGGGVSTAQVQQIADAVLAKIGTPTVTIDYQAIADAVNDNAAARMAD